MKIWVDKTTKPPSQEYFWSHSAYQAICILKDTEELNRKNASSMYSVVRYITLISISKEILNDADYLKMINKAQNIPIVLH